MPGFLAAEYGWAVASALRTVHGARAAGTAKCGRGCCSSGPLSTKAAADGSIRRRPAPNATVKLAETGLIPLRPPAAAAPPPADALAYLPPVRIDGAGTDPRGRHLRPRRVPVPDARRAPAARRRQPGGVAEEGPQGRAGDPGRAPPGRARRPRRGRHEDARQAARRPLPDRLRCRTRARAVLPPPAPFPSSRRRPRC